MSIYHIIEDETGIYVTATNGQRDYLVPKLIEYGGQIVYQFETDKRVLRASISPNTLDTLLKAEGWTPGRDVVLPDPNLRAGELRFLRFPVVKRTEPSQFGRGSFFYDRLKHPSKFGIRAAISRAMQRKSWK